MSTLGRPTRDEFAAYTTLARAVIAAAVEDITKDRHPRDQAIAKQFLMGATPRDRAVLTFWCQVAGINSSLVRTVAREKL